MRFRLILVLVHTRLYVTIGGNGCTNALFHELSSSAPSLSSSTASDSRAKTVEMASFENRKPSGCVKRKRCPKPTRSLASSSNAVLGSAAPSDSGSTRTHSAGSSLAA